MRLTTHLQKGIDSATIGRKRHELQKVEILTNFSEDATKKHLCNEKQ